MMINCLWAEAPGKIQQLFSQQDKQVQFSSFNILKNGYFHENEKKKDLLYL